MVQRGQKSVDKEFEERCQQCLGIYITKLIKGPDGGQVRRACAMCGRQCNTYCNGCKRVLCFIAPQDRKVRVRVKIKPRKPKRGKKKKSKKAKNKKRRGKLESNGCGRRCQGDSTSMYQSLVRMARL